MRSRSNLPVFLAYALLCLLVVGYLAAQMGGEFALGGYRVTASFHTGAELVAGDDVTMSGLRVGKVESLNPAANATAVTLLLHRDFAPLYADARAVVRQKNLLGETYVELNRGTSSQPAIADGGTIPLDRTLTPVEIDQVLNALDPTVRDQLTMVINTLGQATAGRGQDMNAAAADLASVATDLQALAHTLARNSDHLDALIADLRKIMDTLAAWHADFRAMITDWDHVMATLASREQNLKGTIVEQDRVMAILDQALAGGAAQQLHGALAEAPATIDRANHYLVDAKTVFGVVQSDTPGIFQLFNELASVMSGVGVAKEAGPDNGKTVHMWRVYCAGACFVSP
ncbi:MAG: MCE family protein [Candidatus Dormibacteraeota bacterium]|nr:MCE family protein [Candidatus Dormibacteraeota bacterium]